MRQDYDPPDGACQDCGIDLDADPAGSHDESHRQCWKCWRGDRSDPPAEPSREARRESRPAPGTAPESFIVALADLRRELQRIRERLDRLEGRDAA